MPVTLLCAPPSIFLDDPASLLNYLLAVMERNAVPIYEVTDVDDTTAAMLLVNLLEEGDIAV